MFNKFRKLCCALLTISMTIEAKKPESISLVGNPLSFFHPCKDNEDVVAYFETGKAPNEENLYSIKVGNVDLPKYTEIILKFDSAAKVTLHHSDKARIFGNYIKEREFTIHFFKDASAVGFDVKGPESGTVPYVTSMLINGNDHCAQPDLGFLDRYIHGYKAEAEIGITQEESENSCGTRKVLHTGLIVNGLDTKPGDWPWHVALYKLEKSYVKYICGGTLISKTSVLTAAHCVTTRGKVLVPELVHVVLGKHDLYLGDSNAQEMDVNEIKVHDQFTTQHLENDIALLKLKNEVTLSDYVQPACLWEINDQKKLPIGQEFGTVVGWGLNEDEVFATELRQVKIPKWSPSTCIKSNPVFFSNVLNNKKFCAGYSNGTSPCNGDSGGGFHVLVPNISGDNTTTEGSWHVRGVVSLAISRLDKPICNPKEYVLFTDVTPYREWILKNI